MTVAHTLPEWMQHIEDSLTTMQKMVRHFIMSRPASSIMVDMGGGKTLTTLSALTYITPPNTHILVIAPKAIATNTWTGEIEQWNIPLNVVSLTTNDRDKNLSRADRYMRYEAIKNGQYPPSMVIISEANLVDMIAYFGDDWPFPIVIIDEAQMFKSHKSKKFIALAAIRDRIDRIIELTGTPMPQGIEDIWSQIYILDQGAALGKNITAFRMKYCHAIPINDKAVKYIPRNGALKEVIERISHLALASYNTELSLPDLIMNDVYTNLDDDVAADYKEFALHNVIEAVYDSVYSDLDAESEENDGADNNTISNRTEHSINKPDITPGTILSLMDTLGDISDDGVAGTITADNAAVLRMKLLQMANGTVYLDDVSDQMHTTLDMDAVFDPSEVINDDVLLKSAQSKPAQLGYKTLYLVDNRIAVNFHNDKITQLIDIIHQTNSPVLVAYRFRSDLVKIQYFLTLAGINVKAFDKSRAMVTAWNRGEIPVMLIHPASAGHGLNLQHGGHTFVWYGLPDSLEHYLQAQARLYRPGQQNDVTIHRLVTEGTVEEDQIERLIEKRIEQDTLLEGLHHSPMLKELNDNPSIRQRLIDAAVHTASIKKSRKNVDHSHDHSADTLSLIESMLDSYTLSHGDEQ